MVLVPVGLYALGDLSKAIIATKSPTTAKEREPSQPPAKAKYTHTIGCITTPQDSILVGKRPSMSIHQCCALGGGGTVSYESASRAHDQPNHRIPSTPGSFTQCRLQVNGQKNSLLISNPGFDARETMQRGWLYSPLRFESRPSNDYLIERVYAL